MPTYAIETTDGREYEVELDREATDAELAALLPQIIAQSEDIKPERAPRPAPPTGSQWTEPFRGLQRGMLSAGIASETMTATAAAKSLEPLKEDIRRRSTLQQDTSLSPVFAGPEAKAGPRAPATPLELAQQDFSQQAIGRLVEGIGASAASIAERATKRAALPKSEAMQRFDTEDWWKAWLANPVEVTSTLFTEALPQMVPGMAMGAVVGTMTANPLGTAAGVGAGSFAVEAANGILEAAQDNGVDLDDPQSLVEFFLDPERLAAAQEQALKGGVPVAAWDAWSGGIAGKLIAPVLDKGAKKIIQRSVAEGVLQGAYGGAGEVSKALVLGKPIDWREVAAEVVLEIPGSIPETMTNIRSGRAKAAAEKAKQPAAVPEPEEEMPAEATALTPQTVRIQPPTSPGEPGVTIKFTTAEGNTGERRLPEGTDPKAALESLARTMPGSVVNEIVSVTSPPNEAEAPAETTPLKGGDPLYGSPPAEESEPAEITQDTAAELKAALEKNQVEPVVTPPSAAPLPAKPKQPRTGRRTERPPDLIDEIQGRVSNKINLRLIREANPDFKPVGAARKLFSATRGEAADTALNSLAIDGVGYGIERDMGMDEFGELINDAARSRKGWRGAEADERRKMDEMGRELAATQKQKRKFTERVLEGQRPKATAGKVTPVAVNDLLEGDKFKVEGVELEVAAVDYDEDGTALSVTLKDGPKFGVQVAYGQETIHLDPGSLKHPKAAATKTEPGQASPETPFSLKAKEPAAPTPTATPTRHVLAKPADERTRATQDQVLVAWARNKLGPLGAKLRAVVSPPGRGTAPGTRPVQERGAGEGVRPGRSGGVREALEELFSVRIVMVENADGSPTVFNGVVPDASRRVILIDKTTRKPVLAVAGHELGEMMSAQDPETYRALMRELEPLMRHVPEYQAKLNRLRAGVAKRPSSQQRAMEELANDFIGDQMAKPEFWQRLAAKDPNLFERVARLVYQWIADTLERMRGLKDFGSEAHFTDLEKAREVVATALREFAARSQALPLPESRADGRGSAESLRDTDAELTKLLRKPNRTAADNARITELQAALGQIDLFATDTKPLAEIEREKQKEEIAARQAKRLVGGRLDTQGDMFGKPGQQEMFSLRDEPARRATAGKLDTPLGAQWIAAGAEILDAMPQGTVFSQWKPRMIERFGRGVEPFLFRTWDRVRDAQEQARFSLSGEAQEALNRIEAHAAQGDVVEKTQPPVYDPDKAKRWWQPFVRNSDNVRFFGGDALLKKEQGIDLVTDYQKAAVRKQQEALTTQLEDSLFSADPKLAVFPKWARWIWPKTRLRAFMARALPTAAHLHVTGGTSGAWEFTDFEQRAGFIRKTVADKRRIAPGQRFLQSNPLTAHMDELVVGPEITLESGERGYQILRPLSAQTQALVYDAMKAKFPEFTWLIDLWVDPGMKGVRDIVNGVEIPVFNRWALAERYQEGHPEFQIREAYTPDVALSRGIIGKMQSMFAGTGRAEPGRKIRQAMSATRDRQKWFRRDPKLRVERGTYSPGRLYETGTEREFGNVHDLLSGWSVRTFQVLQEESRKKWMLEFLKAAAPVPNAARPLDVPAGWEPIRPMMEKLFSAFQQVMTLAPTVDLHGAAKPLDAADSPEFARFFGEAVKLKSEPKMVPKPLVDALIGNLAGQAEHGKLFKLASWYSRNYRAGLLLHTTTWITNRTDNYLRFLMRANRQITLAALRGGDKQAFREARNMVWGSLANLIPGVRQAFHLNHQTLFKKVVEERLPEDIFTSNTRMVDIQFESRGPMDQIRTLYDQGKVVRAAGKAVAEAGAVGLELIKYSNLDVRGKQQFAFTTLLARAQTLGRKQGLRGRAFREFVNEWMTTAPTEEVALAVAAANRWLLDYKDSPPWLQAAARHPIFNTSLVTFMTYGYHFVGRELDFATAGFRSLHASLVRGKKLTREQKVEAWADTISYATLPAMGYAAAEVLGALAGSIIGPALGALGGDDDDDPRQVVGSSVRLVEEDGEITRKALARELVTANRLNVSWILRRFGLDGDGDTDYWWYFKNYPVIRSSAVFWQSAQDVKKHGAWQGTRTLLRGWTDMLSSIINTGPLPKVIAKTAAEMGADSERAAFTAWDPYATGVPLPAYLTLQALNLVPFQRQANEVLKWVDPTPRRIRSSKLLDYQPGVAEALQAEGITGLMDRMLRGGESPLPPQGTISRRRGVVLTPRQHTLAARIAALAGQNVKPIPREEYAEALEE